MDLERAHEIARRKGANPIVCWIARILLWPVFLAYFRFERQGKEHIPKEGPLLFAANHRSFSDPFFIGICIRRPLRYVAKVELFDKRWKARLLLALGAFPIRRGESDEMAMETARTILEQGGVVGIFPEGTRVRPGPLGEPKSGVGRLALETGAPIVPVAISGTEDIRAGWRIRPRKVRLRFGRALTFPRPIDQPTTVSLAREITSRAWTCVALQWEWLGGMAPIRTAAVVGAGSFGTAAAMVLARGGATVELGCRTREQAHALERSRRNDRYLPGVELPAAIEPVALAKIDLSDAELVCLAVPSRALPGAIRAIAPRLRPDAGVLILSKGLIAHGGELPSEHVARVIGRRSLACLGGPGHAAEVVGGQAGLVVASRDRAFAARVAQLVRSAGLECEASDDVVGVQLAACAKNAAALATGAALSSGLNGAGMAAGRVYEECYALARARGATAETFAGLAGAGDLVATVLATGSRNRRAGELLAAGATTAEIERSLGQAAEAIDLIPLLAHAMRLEGIRAPTTARLAALIAERGRPREAKPERIEAGVAAHVA